MATRNQTKATLSASTANVGEKPGSNVVPILDEKTVLAYVVQAFKDDDEGNEKKGAATQRMAAAILVQYEAWTHKLPDELTEMLGDEGLPELSRCFHSAKARQAIVPLFREVFLEKIPTGLDRDDKATAEAKKASHGTLIVNGTKLAAVLATHNVSARAFDDKTSRFRVPVKAIEPKGCLWLGALANHPAGMTLPLDGLSYDASIRIAPDAVDGDKDFNKTRPARIKASANQLYSAANSFVVKTPKAGGPETKKPGVAETAEILKGLDPANISLGWLIMQTNAKLMDEKGKDRFKDGDYNNVLFSREWEAFTDNGMWCERAKASKGFRIDALDVQMGATKKTA